MPEWLWVWGANVLNRSLRKEALSCKAWSRVKVGNFCQLAGACSILTFGRTRLPSVFSFITEYLAYCWLIVCKAYVILSENAVEKPQGPHHTDGTEVNNDWGTRTGWGNLNFDAFFFPSKLSKSHAIYVVLWAAAISIVKYNTTCQLSSFRMFFFFFKGNYLFQ